MKPGISQPAWYICIGVCLLGAPLLLAFLSPFFQPHFYIWSLSWTSPYPSARFSPPTSHFTWTWKDWQAFSPTPPRWCEYWKKPDLFLQCVLCNWLLLGGQSLLLRCGQDSPPQLSKGVRIPSEDQSCIHQQGFVLQWETSTRSTALSCNTGEVQLTKSAFKVITPHSQRAQNRRHTTLDHSNKPGLCSPPLIYQKELIFSFQIESQGRQVPSYLLVLRCVHFLMWKVGQKL